ncbi:MFS transporter [Conexibacter sp. JD483]|uniref:MFS transporter n=1 Tax=unclassified Conexibacter TaxID=2627773 RepID=UPI00272774FE|nr:MULTISPECIES: MFS transporter [unclassified Conexibacter]MDO8187652.1 MFS transporter [Conexibacter sp. CPCC 205706]MDO8199837.1 MFS transporter [Conexibacter sp. CPCC 205762]MDR9370214.1 MFS transporter [Conexibacter sp. JD483]
MLTYRRVLAVSGLPRLLATALVARLPMGLTSLAILIVVREATGSFALAGTAVAAYSAASALALPLLGGVADRCGRRQVLLPCALLHSSLLLTLSLAARLGASGTLLVGGAALVGATLPPVSACLRSLWPQLLPAPELRQSAYALDAIAQEVVFVSGPLLVALAVAVLEAPDALIAAAAFALAGTLGFVAVPAVRHARPSPRRPEGGRSAVSSAPLRTVLVAILLAGVYWGVLQVGISARAVDLSGPGLAGVLLALFSVGSFAGGLWYGSRSWRAGLVVRYAAAFAALAVATLPLLVAGSAPAAGACALLAGSAFAPAVSTEFQVLSEIAPAELLTEAFAWASSAMVLGVAAGSVSAGWVIDRAGVTAALSVAPAAIALAALWVALHRRGALATGSASTRSTRPEESADHCGPSARRRRDRRHRADHR